MNRQKLLNSIPEFRSWRQNVSSDNEAMDNYMSFNHKVKHLIMTIDLIAPVFLEKNGMILRARNLPENIDEYLNDLQNNHSWSPNQIEYAVNHIHLEDYFFNDEDLKTYPSEVIGELANFIAQMWAAKLKKDFPDKIFEVGVDLSTGWEIYSYQDEE